MVGEGLEGWERQCRLDSRRVRTSSPPSNLCPGHWPAHILPPSKRQFCSLGENLKAFEVDTGDTTRVIPGLNRRGGCEAVGLPSAGSCEYHPEAWEVWLGDIL